METETHLNFYWSGWHLVSQSVLFVLCGILPTTTSGTVVKFINSCLKVNCIVNSDICPNILKTKWFTAILNSIAPLPYLFLKERVDERIVGGKTKNVFQVYLLVIFANSFLRHWPPCTCKQKQALQLTPSTVCVGHMCAWESVWGVCWHLYQHWRNGQYLYSIKRATTAQAGPVLGSAQVGRRLGTRWCIYICNLNQSVINHFNIIIAPNPSSHCHMSRPQLCVPDSRWWCTMEHEPCSTLLRNQAERRSLSAQDSHV